MMVANGGNMVRKLLKGIHALEPIIVAQLHQDAQLESRYLFYFLYTTELQIIKYYNNFKNISTLDL